MSQLVKSYELLKSDYDNKLAMLVKMTKLNTELQRENIELKEAFNKCNQIIRGI